MISEGPYRVGIGPEGYKAVLDIHGKEVAMLLWNSRADGPLLAASWGLAKAAEEVIRTRIDSHEQYDPCTACSRVEEYHAALDALATELAKAKGVKP